VLLVADPDAGVDAVSVDERRGAYRAVRHLIDIGHKRIGIIDSSNPMGNHEKRDGYMAALNEAGIAPRPDPLRRSARPFGHSRLLGHG
jgi:LacI family transcriptional regulator